MEIKNRLFPYPVLCENDDYIGSTFLVDCTLTEDLNNIELNIEILLENCPELQFLIRDGYAQFFIHLECSNTALRRVYKTVSHSLKISIPKTKVNNEVSIVGMIVAARDIVGYYSKNLNEDYEGETIDFKKGSILAYYNLPSIKVLKNYEELAGEMAFFTIIKRHKDSNCDSEPIVFDVSDHKIKITVDPDIYDTYLKFRLNPNMEAVNAVMLLMPALAYAIDTLRFDGAKSYKTRFWYQKISESCSLQGVDFEEQFLMNDNLTSIEIAQKMLNLPINRAFVHLSSILES